MSEWSNLPNAAHIDRVLAHVRAHPDKWNAAWDAAYDAAYDAARDAAWDAAREAAWDAARDATWDAAREAAWDAARDAAREADRDAVWDAAWGVCSALVAWDEASELLDQPVSLVRFLAKEEVHAAVLLLPAVIAMEVKDVGARVCS